jgi:type IV pilus assembly protein PilW
MSNKSSSGMTIVELLIATACMALIMGAVFVIFSSQSKTATFEREIIDMQLNSRVVMERLTFLFSHAGFGCSESFQDGKTMSGDDPDNATMPIDSFLWDIHNNNSTGYTPDSVVVVYGFKTDTYAAGDNSKTSLIDCNGSLSITSDEDDFKNYICLFPDIAGDHFYKVDQVPGNDIKIEESLDMVIDKSSVYIVSPTRVKLVDNTLQFQNIRYDNENMWNLADNIQDIQFRYTTDGSAWVEVPSEPNDVIGVAINLLVRSESIDPNYTDVKTYEYQWPDGTTEVVGPFNSTLNKYHRKHSRAHVWLRNTE